MVRGRATLEESRHTNGFAVAYKATCGSCGKADTFEIPHRIFKSERFYTSSIGDLESDHLYIRGWHRYQGEVLCDRCVSKMKEGAIEANGKTLVYRPELLRSGMLDAKTIGQYKVQV